MVHAGSGLALCYNGEIYNHTELRGELRTLGHEFRSQSDTEVLLHAWLEWGVECLPRLNGMFAFVLLDPRSAELYAVRDRFGVKPLYVGRVNDSLVFASEIKQLRVMPGYSFQLDEAVARGYLAYGLVDHDNRTFDDGVKQVRGGEYAAVRLDDPDLGVTLSRWYELKAARFAGSLQRAASDLRTLLEDSVRLRLRADVPVGSCLSGGLDSSAIVCLAHRLLSSGGASAGQVTVTACYEDSRFDEWNYARQVVERTDARAVRVWPNIERLESEFDVHLWHLDEPVGSSSLFSQWCVFGGAADAGLKVMLDGQGSDEQLAGYGGADAPLYRSLLRRWSLPGLVGEMTAFRRRRGTLPLGPLLAAARSAIPSLDSILPSRLRAGARAPAWVLGSSTAPFARADVPDLGGHLRDQLLRTSLPALLRYEDRNSMAWSVESRVPFLDYRLVEFLAGIPDTFKLHRGTTKLVFREAMQGVLPEPIRERTDKMGFVTPEEVWLRRTATTWFRAGVELAIELAPQLLDADRTWALFDSICNGSRAFTHEPWRILCFGRWLGTVMTSGPRVAESMSGIA